MPQSDRPQLLFLFVQCECPQTCDCEKPPTGDPKKDEVLLVSNLCPEHNWDPIPEEHCMLHGDYDPPMSDTPPL